MKKVILAGVALLTLCTPMFANAEGHHGWGGHGGGFRTPEGRHDWGRDRREGGWDYRSHNGYYYHDRWYWGPPPVAYYGDPYFRPGFLGFSVGVTLPSDYWDDEAYYIDDYGRWGLFAPYPGCRWLRIRGQFILVDRHSGYVRYVR